MRHRSILVTVLLFISFFASCPSSFADGYYVPEQYVKLPNIPVQRALIKYRDGVETLIVESTLDGPGQKFGWIIPVPNVPQRFEKVTPGVLKTLSVSLQPTITHHRPRSRNGAFLRFLFPFLFSAWALAMLFKCFSILRKESPSFMSIIKFDIWLAIIMFVGAPLLIMFVSSFFAVYGSSGPLPPPTTVRVESRHLVGDYEISVVTAHKSSDLNNWLGDNGFRSFPDKAISAVDDYIAKNWAFIAAKIHREGEGTATPHPILIEFKTDRPVYPMRLTALSDSAVNLELFVLAAEEAVPVGYDLEKKYCDYFDYESSYSLYRFRKENIPLYVARAKRSYRSIADTIGHPHAMKLMWNGCVLTKLAGEVSSEQMKEDMFFSLKQAAPYRHHVYSSRWVIERGIIVAIVIGLFGLQGLCFLYKKRERVSPLLLPGLFIVCLAIFSAIYFGFEKVEATSLFKDYDWSSYETEIYALMTDCLDEIPEPSDNEINTYLSEHQTYTKNILTNQSVVVEDSPGNITLERNGLKRSLILHLPNGTTKILMEFVARIDNVDQLDSLLDILKEDQGGHLRYSVKNQLRVIHDSQAIDLLVTKLKDEDPRIRRNVAWLLGQSKSSSALKPLLVALKDQDEGVRAAAATSLGELRDPRAVKPLLFTTLKDQYWQVRANAASALGEIGDKRAVEHLTAALNDPERLVRKRAASALKPIESRIAYFESRKAYFESKIAKLKDEDYRVRNKAVWALIRSRDPQALEALIAAQQHEDPSVRVLVAWALSKKNDLRGLGTLLAALKDESPEIRSLAAGLLKEIQDPRVVEALITALQDESQRVRTRAAMTLEYHRDPRAVCALIEAVDDSSSQVRWWAIHGLKKMDAEIAAALEDKNSCVHDSILKTLHKTDDLRTAEELITALQDGHESAKAKTSIALRKQRMQAPARRIVLLEHRNNRVRDRTPKSLHKTDDLRTAEELIAALQDESPPVRIRAAIALGDRGDPRAVNPLIAALDDSNSGVRMWAARALERMGPQLVAALENKDPEVRSMAARALRKITHKDFGEDSARWQKWWEKNKESITHGG